MKLKTKIILINIILAIIIIFFEMQTLSMPKESGFLDVKFCGNGGCKNTIINLINTSNKINCAFYDLQDEEIISILKEKNSQVIKESDNKKSYGKPIYKKGLMHNKFCIFDESIVITGSYNPTTNNKNLNNLIVIQSKQLAKNYQNEFDEIIANENKKTKTTTIIFNNFELKNYFCSEDNCQSKIMFELSKAKEEILFLTFTFTDKKIGNMLIEKKNEGINVSGLIESFQNHDISTYNMLKKANIDVSLDNYSHLQHNKIFIIDKKTVITGSYNPTNAANTINDENILIILEPDIVEKYVEYYYYLKRTY